MNCGELLKEWGWELCGRGGCELHTISIQLYVIEFKNNNDGHGRHFTYGGDVIDGTY